MSRIFISHHSSDTPAALALAQWLQGQALADTFLDADPDRGLVSGERWLEGLRAAGERCRVVLAMVSAAWLRSAFCLAEYNVARLQCRRVVTVLLQPDLMTQLPATMLADTQVCALAGPGRKQSFSAAWQGAAQRVEFLEEGLARLARGLKRAGLTPDHFAWPPPDDPERAPYRGLASLDGRDAAVFFGRDGEIAACIALLHTMRATPDERVLTLIAGSGSGKSSFLRAGLLPRLRHDDEAFLVLDALRPAGGALSGDTGLAQSLVKAARRLGMPVPWTLGDVSARLANEPDALRALLDALQQRARAALGPDALPRPPTIVITVDPAEELFAPDAGPEAARLLDLVAAEIHAGSAPLVLFAIRSDHFEALRTAPALLPLKSRLYDGLRPLDRAHYKDVITGPAEVHSAAGRPLVLDVDLVDRLLADAAQGADALPLLALALGRLWRDHGDAGRLQLAHYLAFGGLDGIVEREAEQALATDPERRLAQLDALRSAFIPWLVNIDPDSGRVVRRRAVLATLPPRSHPAIEALVHRRLLQRDRIDGAETVEVAHEALLRQWPALAGWIGQARGALAEYRAAEQEALSWQAAGEPGTRLWQHERQALFHATLGRLQIVPEGLPQPLKRFLQPEAQRLVDELADSATPLARRVAIGDRLAAIGDVRRGVGVRPDGTPDIDWCEVPPMPDGNVPFTLSRYPVTVAQFRAFLEATATPGGRMPAQVPGNHPQQAPALETVQAFCRWMSERLGSPVSLPTPEQLLWAAGGAAVAHAYPWGPQWIEGRCNTRESGLLRPVAVGLFPAGASPQGLHDLAGQVWELGLPSAESRFVFGAALVGGSWYSCAQQAGCALAPWPSGPRVDVGFRLRRGEAPGSAP